MLIGSSSILSAEEISAPASAVGGTTVTAEPQVLRFSIQKFVVDGATLLNQSDIDSVVNVYTGPDKSFTDVQRALTAVENLYAKQGYSAVRVWLPDQALENGEVHLRVQESRFGKIEVQGNKFVSKENVLNALPSVRTGAVPRSNQISRELQLANENPARQLNVVLKMGAAEDMVDANVEVQDNKPEAWCALLNNSGTVETGRTRAGFSYRNTNAFDADHVASVQYLTSLGYIDRLKVLGGSYKIPLYAKGDSMEFFGGYSNVNSVVGGLSNFQGGGLLFSGRYNYALDRFDHFNHKLILGLDWRDFRRIEMIAPVATVLYKEIVVTPLSVGYAAQGKFAQSDLGFDLSLAANVPMSGKGKAADFAAYDQLNLTKPKTNYKVLRYGANYARALPADWRFKFLLNGQKSNDVLILGEQIRLGGADAVRGFSEGSEGGESGLHGSVETYAPSTAIWTLRARPLAFYDFGSAQSSNGSRVSISSLGVGLRSNMGEQLAMRLDAAKILKAGNDPTQRKGANSIHWSLIASF